MIANSLRKASFLLCAAISLRGVVAPQGVQASSIDSNRQLQQGADLIFADGFESGDLTGWDTAVGEPPGIALPPDPVIVATPLDPTVAYDPYDANRFLWTGDDPIQFDVEPDAIEARRICLVRGRVLERNGSPLRGVRITVLGESELGFTFSRQDGVFDFALNGGGFATFRFEKIGYFSAFRDIQPSMSGFAVMDDLVLVQRDVAVTEIVSDATEMQVARGSEVNDEDGIRRATLLFPAGTSANLVLADGSSSPAAVLGFRATEYTVGENGPMAMPASLPENSGYTYAVELSSDEAIEAGATHVQFDQDVVFYLENFLGFPTGIHVPVGWLDRATGKWVAQPDGRVLEILSADGGIAELDLEGNGQPATPSELAALGISEAERQRIALLYSPGMTLWRAATSHFSPMDLNFPYAPPPDAEEPPSPDPELFEPPTPTPPPEPDPDSAADDGAPPEEDPCESAGSIIECENQTLRESIGLVGVPYRLDYSSDRAVGRASRDQISVRLTRATIPPSLKRIELQVHVAGTRVAQVQFQNPTPNMRHAVQWNRQDRFERPLQGDEPIDIRLTYVYPLHYYQPGSQWQQAFARFSTLGSSLSIGRQSGEAKLSSSIRSSAASVAGLLAGGWDALPERLGGWSLDVHHRYNPRTRTLSTGDGRSRYARDLGIVAPRFAGTGDPGSDGDGGPARAARLEYPSGVTVLPDGSLLIVDAGAFKVRRVAPDGTISTFAGTGQWCEEPGCGDGGLATFASLNGPWGIAVEADGSVLVADYTCVRRVRPSGLIETAAGVCYGAGATECDDCVATEKELFGVSAVAALPGGGFYLNEEFGNRIHYVGAEGRIQRVVGTGIYGYSGDGGPALLAKLATPSSLAIDASGALLISDSENNRIRRVTSSGIIETVAGNGLEGFSGDGGQATSARLYYPRGIAVDPQGRLLIVDWLNLRLRRVSAGGVISTIAGSGGPYGEFPPIPYALQLALGDPEGVTVASTGEIYLTDLAEYHVLEIGEGKPVSTQAEIWIPSEAGVEVYIFDRSGRHLKTRNALTGATLLTFGYDVTGLLTTVTDADGNVTQIVRDEAGAPSSIIGPYGQATALGLDDLGYLTSLEGPAGITWTFDPDLTGLLSGVTDPNGHVSLYQHDDFGRLISAQDAAGGVKVLGRHIAEPGRSNPKYSVSLDTAEGKHQSYWVWKWGRGRTRYRILETGAQELVTRAEQSKDGSAASYSPDGTISHSLRAADPIWGPDVDTLASHSVATPSGLTKSTIYTQQSAVANPFDPFSLLERTESLTVNGHTFESTYSQALRQWLTETPLGRESRLEIDPIGRPLESQFATLLPTHFAYDDRGRLESIQRGAGVDERRMSFTYDSTGRLASVTDPLDQEVTFTYDDSNRVLTQTLPGGRTVGFGWDSKGNLRMLTPPGKPAHSFDYSRVDLVEQYSPPNAGQGSPETTYDYDLDQNPTLITRPDGREIALGYDDAKRLTTITSHRGTKTIDYDPDTGHVKTLTTPEGNSLTLEMQGPLLTKTTWSGQVNGSVERTYDTHFRLDSISVNGASPISYGYDDDGLLIQAGAMMLTRDPANGLLTGTTLGVVTTNYFYSPFGELSGMTASVSGSPIYTTIYTRDKLARISRKVDTVEGITNVVDYAYDAAGRLSTVTRDGVVSASYTYDLNGNRLSRVTHLGVESGSYDVQDRMSTYAGATYLYGANGETISKTSGDDITGFSFDVFGNLASVQLPDGSEVSYVVDAENRRIARSVDGSISEAFVWQDQLAPIALLDPQGSVTKRFVFATRRNVPDYLVVGGATHRILHDDLGSPRLVVRVDTGEISQRLAYEEFGAVSLDSNPTLQPFRYAGGLGDSATNLVRFDTRSFDPSSGRWLSRDSIGFSAGDTNLYTYAGSDPTNQIDLDGKLPLLAALLPLLEVAFTVQDFVDVYDTFSDPCSSALDRGLSGGGALLGLALPGGGYGRAAKAGQRTIRNAHLAGLNHPRSGIPFDLEGFPDFSGVSRATVEIQQSGNRASDYAAANRAAGISQTPNGFTWHHHQNGTTMQLVPTSIHMLTGHTGGVGLMTGGF